MSDLHKSRFSLLFLTVFLVAIACWRPLALPDEGRYADVARWMLVTGDWLTPQLNGIPFFHKPPLLYWLQVILMKLFGISVWCIRLVPIMHAILMLFAMYMATRKIGGERLALRAIWILGTSLTILAGGQFLNHDILVATWISIAIWSLAGSLLCQPSHQRFLILTGFSACGLAMLSKGLIGVVLPSLVILIWIIIKGLWQEVVRLPWKIAASTLFLTIVLPWFLISQMKYPGFFDYIIINQHFKRYVGSNFNQHQPFWFYLASLAVVLFPWAFLPLRDLWSFLNHGSFRRIRQFDAWHILLWVWFTVILIFFSIPQSKLIGYIFPASPALAVLAALSWEKYISSNRWAQKGFFAICLINLCLGLVFSIQSTRSTEKKSSTDVGHVLGCLHEDSDIVMVAHGYPYDLSFNANLKKPLIVIQDWPTLRSEAQDSWARELYEGTDFEPHTADLLQNPEVLDRSSPEGFWLVTPENQKDNQELLEKWRLVYQGRAWLLWRSPATSLFARKSSAHNQTKCADIADLPN